MSQELEHDSEAVYCYKCHKVIRPDVFDIKPGYRDVGCKGCGETDGFAEMNRMEQEILLRLARIEAKL